MYFEKIALSKEQFLPQMNVYKSESDNERERVWACTPDKWLRTKLKIRRRSDLRVLQNSFISLHSSDP